MARIGARSSAVGHLVAAFVEAVRRLPQVQRVLVVEPESEHPWVWTIISAPPFELADREPVYRAQLQAIDAVPDATVQFRLINVEELTHPLEQSLPTPHRLVYDRGNQD